MDDLAERCREILEWKNTGLLQGGAGGKLRAYAASLTDVPEDYRLAVAEKNTGDEAMRFVVEHTKARD